MSDYKSDLESLKNAMKFKDQEDRNLLDSLVEEKRAKDHMYQKATQEIKELKEQQKFYQSELRKANEAKE